MDHQHLVRALYEALNDKLGDNLAGKATFDDFAFEVAKSGRIELTDDGEDIVDEALFLAAGPEAAGLPGYLGRGRIPV